MRRPHATWILALAWLAVAPLAHAQPLTPITPDEIPLEDLLEVMLIDRELLAMNARRGGQLSERPPITCRWR